MQVQKGSIEGRRGLVNHSDDPELINCALKDPAEGEYEPQLELLRDVKAGTMLYRDYGKKYWQGREHEITDESVSDCGKCITLTLTHDYFDSFPDRAPLVADSPSAPMRCGLQSFLPGLLFGLPRQGLRINLRIKLVPDAFVCN